MKSMQSSKRYTNPTSYEIHTTTEQMYRVRFTNGLSTRLSETGLERWGNIASYEKEGTREIHYITMQENMYIRRRCMRRLWENKIRNKRMEENVKCKEKNDNEQIRRIDIEKEPLLPINKTNCIVIGIVMVMHGIIVGSIFNYIYRVSECGLC